MIKVLVVEDSPVARNLITQILNSEPEIQVVATAVNGVEAINLARKFKPHVITMDVNLPLMNGLETTKTIMETDPVPIIIVSSEFNPRNMNDTFRALAAGAVAVAEKPHSVGTKEFEVCAARLIQSVKLMSEIKVVRRLSSIFQPQAVSQNSEKLFEYFPRKKVRVIGIGTSTGGPMVVEKILSGLPENFPIPILLVQHITIGFTEGYISWLNLSSKIPVTMAKNGMSISGGGCFVAPDNIHMEVKSSGVIELVDAEPEYNSKPSVSRLFRSLSRNFGSEAVGILLTGMGRDGALELKHLRDSGGTTIAQDSDSSIIFGMPGEAVKLNAAQYIFPPEKIISFLKGLIS